MNPDGMVLGELHRGRVCYLYNGAKLKVLRSGIGSVTVSRQGTPRTIKGRTFTPTKKETLAPSTKVYTRKPVYRGDSGLTSMEWIQHYCRKKEA